jgi:5-methylcytosine-specific restriction endonuclease McrA
MPDAAKQKAYSHKWYMENRERLLVRRKIRYQDNREAVLKQISAYACAHPEIRKKSERNYRKNHRAKLLEQCREYYRNNLNREMERSRVKGRKAYSENKEKILARNRAWAAKNRDFKRLASSKKRALKRAATVNLKAISDWTKSVLSKRSVICYYCQKPTSTKNIHFDHIIALINGGAHSVENLCVACAHCNLSKGRKPVRVWTKINQQLLEL